MHGTEKPAGASKAGGRRPADSTAAEMAKPVYSVPAVCVCVVVPDVCKHEAEMMLKKQRDFLARKGNGSRGRASVVHAPQSAGRTQTVDPSQGESIVALESPGVGDTQGGAKKTVHVSPRDFSSRCHQPSLEHLRMEVEPGNGYRQGPGQSRAAVWVLGEGGTGEGCRAPAHQGLGLPGSRGRGLNYP